MSKHDYPCMEHYNWISTHIWKTFYDIIIIKEMIHEMKSMLLDVKLDTH